MRRSLLLVAALTACAPPVVPDPLDLTAIPADEAVRIVERYCPTPPTGDHVPTNYTGNAVAVQAPSSAPGVDVAPVLALPADGDPCAAASWAQPFKVLGDFVAWLTEWMMPVTGVRSIRSLFVGTTGGAPVTPETGHIIVEPIAPGAAVAAAAGTGASVLVTGGDTAGQIELTSGSASLSTGTLVNLTFAVPYTGLIRPSIQLTPIDANAAGANVYAGSPSATGFGLVARTALGASVVARWHYHVIGY